MSVYSKYIVTGKNKIKLKDFPNVDKNVESKKISKEEALDKLNKNKLKIAKMQDILYADDRYSILVIFQAMDAAGKDGTIKHVFSGINPQGFQVFSFKQPSKEELQHDFLWRCTKALPEKGRIGVFNRSYYEDVLVVKVHDLIEHLNLPKELKGKDVWDRRYESINNFEKHIIANGCKVVKIFLNVSKDEQKKRFLSRIDDESKNWKFSEADVKERAYWDEYQKAFEQMLNATSTQDAPWYVVPADKKWHARYIVSEIIKDLTEEMDIEYPQVSDEQKSKLEVYRDMLTNEK